MDKGGNENYQIFATDLDVQIPQLTPYDGIKAAILKRLRSKNYLIITMKKIIRKLVNHLKSM
jgi:hypothetical protein